VSNWIIDDDGEITHFYSQRLRSKLHVGLLQEQDHIPLLRNLGFIGLRQAPQGVFVTLRPLTVSRVAFVGLAYWIHDESPERLLLAPLDAGHCLEFYASGAQGLDRIQALIEEHQRGATGRLRRQSLALEAMPASLLPAFDVWRLSGAACEYASLAQLLERELGGKYLLAEPDFDGARFIIRDAGSGLHIPDPTWAMKQRGRSIADAPDKAYGQWATEAYRTAFTGGTPQLDRIEASVRWTQAGLFQHRYTRLILPVVCHDRPMLLAVNNSAGGIRRHFKAA
jgi:hypothetical protein